MYPIPDFSYFSIPGFIESIRKRQVKSYSLFLHNGTDEIWDKTLSEEDAYIYTSLHNTSGEDHDIFLPHTASNNFIDYYKKHLNRILKPALENIKIFLKSEGFKNSDSYMKNDDYWLKYLYANKENHYSACEFMTKKLNLKNDLPAILVWQNIDDNSLLVIYPKTKLKNVGEYIKDLYESIVIASNKRNRGIIELKNNILKELGENNFNSINKVNLDFRIAELLKMVGKFYSNQFDEAINNFQKEVKACKEENNINDIYKVRDYKKKEIENILKEYNFKKLREGSNHEVWYNSKANVKVILPRHPKITPFVASSIRNTIFNKVVNVF